MSDSIAERTAREDLAAAHRLTVMENLHEGVWNHFSLEHPEHPEQIFLTPGHLHWSEVCAGNLVLMGPQREIISGEHEPNVAAWIIHYPVQRARPDLKCLMHVHTPYATAMGMRPDIAFSDRSCQAAGHFYGQVAYFDTYDGSVDAEEGERMAEALGNKRVLMLRNHGVLVGGETVGHAWHNLYLLERACMFQMLAVNGASPEGLSLIPVEAAEGLAEYARNPLWQRRFGNLRRVLDKREPDYRN